MSSTLDERTGVAVCDAEIIVDSNQSRTDSETINQNIEEQDPDRQEMRTESIWPSMEDRGVAIRRIRALRGPNVHAYMPVLQITIDIGKYDDLPSTEFDGMKDRLLDWLPGLRRHTCSIGEPNGFVTRLERGTYLAHIAEHIAIELQNVMGFNVAFGRARGTSEPGVYNVIVEYAEEVPARSAVYSAVEIALAAMHNDPIDIRAEFEHLIDLADQYKLGPSSQAIISAARRRGIPVLRLRDTSGLVQLGYGKFQERISASTTSRTNSIGVDICQEKRLTNDLLRTLGLPTPISEIAPSPEAAWRIAQDIGLPVVVKPAAGNQGKGVSVNLSTKEEVVAAFEIADHYGKVLVERHLQGDDYRMLVVNSKLAAAARREPASVRGDGEHSIKELVEITNRDPKRKEGHSGALTKIEINDAAMLVLEQQGMSPESIPADGEQVFLRNNGNLSTGGVAVDVTDEVCPSTARAVELAAQYLRLDIAGIDVVCKDISQPLEKQGGGIVEVNAAPGLRMHLDPVSGKSRDVGSTIIEMLYPKGAPSRIPIVAVTGTNGKTTVTRLIAHILRCNYNTVGMTCTDGTYIGDEEIMVGDCSGPKSAQAVLFHPRVDAAVLETARGGIMREGLAFDKCAVGVVTNVSADHLGIGGIETVEELARVKQVVVENVDRNGYAVLNAEDPLVAAMAERVEASIIYFSRDPEHEVVRKHRQQGGRAVSVIDGMISLVINGNSMELVALDQVAFTGAGRIGFQIENALAAVAAAWAVGIAPATIASALGSFATDAQTTPGRFNVQSINDIEVIVDYGHNPAAINALVQGIQAMAERPTTLIIGLPGDRRDDDLIQSIQATVPLVSRYYLHDQLDRRGRRENELPQLLKQALPEEKEVNICSDQDSAIATAWPTLTAGDRLLIIADKVAETLAVLDALPRVESDTTDTPQSEQPDHVRILAGKMMHAAVNAGGTDGNSPSESVTTDSAFDIERNGARERSSKKKSNVAMRRSQLATAEKH